MNIKYVLIQDGEIIKFRNVPNDDTLLISKLIAHDYLIIEEQQIPIFDQITQYISDQYEIQKDKVVHIWKVHEVPFDDAKQMKINMIKQQALDNISMAFEGTNQVTVITKIIQAKEQSIANIKTLKTNQDLREVVYAT